MNWARARCRRASGPFMTEKRAPESLAPISKSSPSGVPRSTWSLGVKSNCGGVPQRRTSTLALSSAPTGTLACGRLGTASSSACSSAWICSRRVAERSSSSLSCATSAMSVSAFSPRAFCWPICLERLLRRACSSSVRVCSVLRSASSAWKAATSRKGWGFLRVSSRAMALGRSLRRRRRSSMRGILGLGCSRAVVCAVAGTLRAYTRRRGRSGA